jgi:hypothetical protein
VRHPEGGRKEKKSGSPLESLTRRVRMAEETEEESDEPRKWTLGEGVRKSE